jgi:hypothetical protein
MGLEPEKVMILKPIGNDGSLTSTGTLPLDSRILGGVLITADGTNNATVIVRTDSATGQIIFKLVTKSPAFITGPIRNGGSNVLYYDVSGTGAAAMFYEWVE